LVDLDDAPDKRADQSDPATFALQTAFPVWQSCSYEPVSQEVYQWRSNTDLEKEWVNPCVGQIVNFAVVDVSLYNAKLC
jgi:hypothetical protein